MRWKLAPFLLLAGSAFAQGKWPIASIQVEGLKNYTQAQVLAAAGLKVGQLAGKADFDAARDRLVATGVFETVGYHFAPAADSNKYAATFDVVEVGPLYPVRFEGMEAPSAELESALRRKDPFFGPKIPATEAILKRHSAVIESVLVGKGSTEKIVGKVVSDSADKFSIVFRPANGPPKVAQVRFEGNSIIATSTLLNNFGGVAYGTVYSEAAFRQLLDSQIRPFFDAQGLIRVAFPSIKVEKAQGVEGLVVSVQVEEGEPYQLGEVRLTGPTPIPAKELVKVGGFKTEGPANFDQIETGLDAMKKRLRREGYMRVALKVERRINQEKKTVDLEVLPELGPQYTFGILTLQGLDIHGEAAVRKLWTMKGGKPFNADYPDYFLSQIKAQGVFDGLGDSTASTKIDEENHIVDVTLNFRPSSTESGVGSRATSRRPGP